MKEVAQLVVTTIFEAQEDGAIDMDDLEDKVLTLVATLVDAVVPTGPLDPLDDQLIRAGLEAMVDATKDLLKPDPAKIRKRAQRARDRGHDKVADNREKRAGRVEARQS